MKKIFIILGIGIILLMLSGVFANSELPEGIKDSIKRACEKRGLKEEDIINVTEVNFDDFPKEINIENVDDTNLAIYKIDHKGGKPIFAITASGEMFQETSVKETYISRMFLHFGFNGEMTGSGFLQTVTGVSSKDAGYVMMRSGSITGISTILEINETSSEKIEIIILKNGELIGFRNTLNVISSGIQKDYDLQSTNIVTFAPGDIISVSVETSEKTILKDIITMIEITV